MSSQLRRRSDLVPTASYTGLTKDLRPCLTASAPGHISAATISTPRARLLRMQMRLGRGGGELASYSDPHSDPKANPPEQIPRKPHG